MLVLLLVLFAQAQPPRACNGSEDAALRQQAHAVLAKRQFAEAIKSLKQALAICPADHALPLDLANAYFMAQRFTDAKAEADRVLAAEPAEPAALKIKANADYLLGNFSEAKDIFIDLMNRHPDDEDAPYMLGRMYYQEGDIAHATGQFERVLKLNPSSYKAWDNLGLCYEARGDNQAATRYFLTSIKLVQKDHPEYDWPYANLANLLIKTGDNQRAFDAAAMAANRNPSSARNFYLGGKALFNLGKTSLSLNWLPRSVALDPDYPQPLYLLVRVYHRLGLEQKSAEAQRKFIQARAKTPAMRR